MPRYQDTWDVKPVLSKLKQMEPLQTLSLKDLTMKLVMLMALTQAARVQTLHLLVLRNISIKEDSISVWLGDNIKQCRPGFNVQFVKFLPYTKDESLCVCRTLRTYLEKNNTCARSSERRMEDSSSASSSRINLYQEIQLLDGLSMCYI